MGIIKNKDLNIKETEPKIEFWNNPKTNILKGAIIDRKNPVIIGASEEKTSKAFGSSDVSSESSMGDDSLNQTESAESIEFDEPEPTPAPPEPAIIQMRLQISRCSKYRCHKEEAKMN